MKLSVFNAAKPTWPRCSLHGLRHDAARRIPNRHVTLPVALLAITAVFVAGDASAQPAPAVVAAAFSTATVLKVQKAYAVQKKLKAMAFAIQGDGAGGELAFVASKQVKQTPVRLSVDLGRTPATRAVNVGGVDVPLADDGLVHLDGSLRARLAAKGVPPQAMGEIEKSVNAAIEVVNTLAR